MESNKKDNNSNNSRNDDNDDNKKNVPSSFFQNRPSKVNFSAANFSSKAEDTSTINKNSNNNQINLNGNISSGNITNNSNDGNTTSTRPQQAKSTTYSKRRKESVGSPGRVSDAIHNNNTVGIKESNTATKSCPEFRSVYRVQTKAYEHRSESPDSFYKHTRYSSNAYVDRLRQFYHLDDIDTYVYNERHLPPVRKIQGIDRSTDIVRTDGKPNKSSIEKLPSFTRLHSDVESILNSPTKQKMDKHNLLNKQEMTGLTKKPSHNVTIILTSPSGKTSTADDALYNNHKPLGKKKSSTTAYQNPHKPKHQPVLHGQDHAKTDHRDIPQNTPERRKEPFFFPNPRPIPSPNVPPPAPILMPPSRQHQNQGRSDSVSSSWSPKNTTQSILEAVQSLNSSRRSSNATGSSNAKPQQCRKKRLSRAALEKDSKNLAMKLSLPCRVGCCYCVYASLLGPVKVYLTRAEKPKKEPWLLGIKDGNGKPVIPVSRKEDITGLVYDAHNHSFHPPSRGQRPMFPAATGGNRMLKTTHVSKRRDAVKKQ